jgi:DNA polymerase
MEIMNDIICASPLSGRTPSIGETQSIYHGVVKKSVLVIGQSSLAGIVRALLLRWLNVVYQVSKFLQGKKSANHVRVFDLLNAGPRHRFATAASIVSNCGYGMGATKYTSYAHVEMEEAEAVIKGFRANNPKITQFWRRLDNLISSAARDKSKHLSIEMPTGDTLQYFTVRPKKGGYEGFVTKGDFGFQSLQPRLWGGTLTENVTQRMARDILAEAVVNLEDAGIPVVFTSHDEAILEIDDDASKDEAIAEANQILKKTPAWAEGLVLDVEGNLATEYTK